MADSTRRTVTQDDSLPPVEPPNAAFLVQLFLVPGIIVAIIVCVWLAFHWLAHLGSDPQAYVKTLRRDNEGRWQAALNLANDLRGPGGGALKSDESLATELGRILGDEVASGRSGEQSQTLSLPGSRRVCDPGRGRTARGTGQKPFRSADGPRGRRGAGCAGDKPRGGRPIVR